MDIMDDASLVCLTPDTISDYGVCGYKNAAKHAELLRKIDRTPSVPAYWRSYITKGTTRCSGSTARLSLTTP